MTAEYVPTINLNHIDPLWETILLTSRDISQDVPINFKEITGVAVSQACFSDGQYTTSKVSCLSNLLVFGYRRLIIDLYWHPDRRKWSMCPASNSFSTISKSTAKFETTGPTSTSTQESPYATTAPSMLYKCDKLFDASFLFKFLADFIDKTEYSLLSTVTIVVLNLQQDQSHTATQGITLEAPVALSSVSSFPESLLYTPPHLNKDRKILNSTWLKGGDAGDDESRYFDVQEDKNGRLSSKDAWPSESYLSLEILQRLIFTYGEIEVPGYSPDQDSDFIFPRELTGWPYSFPTNRTCFFEESDTSVQRKNSSWAVLLDAPTPRILAGTKTLAAIECGYSIVFNGTDASEEAQWVNATNPSNSTNSTVPELAYLTMLNSTIWSWALGEPAAPPANASADEQLNFRCAAVETETGRWAVADCTRKLHLACRIQDTPYNWTLSTHPESYSDATSACPKNSVFDAPRTALENRHLGAAARSKNLPESSVWVDFNSIAVPGCWTAGGDEARCPYQESEDIKKVVVPTVAGVIVVIVGAVMAFVKLGDRRMKKMRRKRRKLTRKRVNHEFEGVPL